MGAAVIRGAGFALALAIGLVPSESRAGFGAPREDLNDLPDPWAASETPAQRYSHLDPQGCEAELSRRDILFSHVDGARGVLAPVRLRGPLHGVTFRTALSGPRRATSPLEIVDCRLVLSLDDFAAQLESHGVVEVVHFSIYRPPSARWPQDRVASRHPGALAIDAATFVKQDGQKLTVERDFHGRIGSPPCSPGSGPQPITPESVELRQILCSAVDARIFNVTLTPDYNWAHRNHFHLELTTGAPRFYLR